MAGDRQRPRHTLLPWVLTAVIEYTATARQQPELRDLAHQRLALARLRYGVPDKDLCEYVRRGADRVVVTQLAADYAALPPLEQFFQHRDDYITARLNPSDPLPNEVVGGAGDIDVVGMTASGPVDQ